MDSIKLSARLAAAASFVPFGAEIVDVGTDHAYLPAALLCSGRISVPAHAFDINEGPVSAARKTAEKYGVSDKMDIRLNNGLCGTDEKLADTVIIAGMGGENIAAIIESSGWRWSERHTLILQPMSRAFELCRWLYENGFYILRETHVKDAGEIYRVLCVKTGNEPMPDELELHTGMLDRCSETDIEFLEKTLRKFRKAADGMRMSKSGDDRGDRLDKLAERAEKELEALKNGKNKGCL